MKHQIKHTNLVINSLVDMIREKEDNPSDESAYRAENALALHINSAVETLERLSEDGNGLAGVTKSSLSSMAPVEWYSLVYHGVRMYLREEPPSEGVKQIGYVLMSALHQYVEENPSSRELVIETPLTESQITDIVYNTDFSLVVGMRGLLGVFDALEHAVTVSAEEER